MIAFTIAGWPIYWYGILYLISFVIGYWYLQYVGKMKRLHQYPGLERLLKTGLDDLIICIIFGVILGGRLGDVLFYNWVYYSQHLDQVLAIWNGGMSFVGGFIGVAIAMFTIKKTKKLNVRELFILFDIIVFFLPFGILCGRIGNGLNQELYGKIMNNELLDKLNIVRIYDKVDNQLRRNTNLIEGFFEGFILLVLNIIVFGKRLIHGIYRPGLLTGVFCIIYGIIRFILETLRDNPPSEYRNGLLKSQLLMVGMMLLGAVLVFLSKNWEKKFDNVG